MTVSPHDGSPLTPAQLPQALSASPVTVLKAAKEALAGMTVYSEPVTHGGVVVIAASRIFGGGGGGVGEQENTGQRGQGAGFGGIALPAGAFVIDADGNVSWRPAHNAVVRAAVVTAAVTAFMGWRIWTKRRA